MATANTPVSATNLPLGSEFDDGVRYGPHIERNYAATDPITGLPNPTLPSAVVPGNYDQWGVGILASAKNTYNIIPRGPNTIGNVVGSITNPGVGELTLSGDNYVATQFMSATGTSALQLDWPRALSVTVGTANFTPGNLTVFGSDYYGYPLQESVAISTVGTYQMNKAFYIVTGAYNNAVTGAGSTLTIQTTDVLGLPYRVKSAGDVDSIRWGNASDLGTSQSMTGYTIADMGQVTLGGGSFQVNTPYVQANSIIQLTYAGGTHTGVLYVGNITAGSNFVIADSVNEAAVVNWTVLNPPPVQGISAAMVGGSVTIPTTAVRSDSVIQLTMGTFGTAAGQWYVSRILPGVSFTVTSTASTETSTVVWAIMPSNQLSGISAPLVPTAGGSIVTVYAPSVAANSKIQLTYASVGAAGTTGILAVPDATIQIGQSFQIKSSNANDVGTVQWTIVTQPPQFIANTATLVGGTVTVANVNVTANSKILLTYNTPGGTLGTYVRVSAITGGTNFTITSQNNADISTINYTILPSTYQTNITTYPLGIFTPADDTPASNTTGDVRGTYKPSSAADGSKVLHFSSFISGFDNFVNQQAEALLPAGGTLQQAQAAAGTPAATQPPLVRSTIGISDQVGIPQYFTGTPA